MIILFGSGQSRSFRALWALEESGLEYEYRHVVIGSPKQNGSQSEQYKQLNFQGKVPSIKHGDSVINESSAILNYIATLSSDINLIPTDLASRAYYDEVCSFVISDLEQPLWTYGKHTFAIPKELRVSDVLPVTHWEFNKSLKALNNYVKDKEFVVGSHFTMADILICHTLNWAEAFKFEVPDNLLAYKERMYARPACLKALKKIDPAKFI